MNNKITPFGNTGLSVNLLPKFYQTPANKKFLQATIDQLFQTGTTEKVNGFVGRPYSKTAKGTDVFIAASSRDRQDYQLEPGVCINDSLGNNVFFKDYIDFINQLNVFGGNTKNHSRLNDQEFYSWDPHIDWDKFVNFQNYYWLPYGPDTINFGKVPYINSTYSVKLTGTSDGNGYVFATEPETVSPVIKLYKGLTYKFVIDSPNNPFSIKTFRSLGTSNRYVAEDLIAGVETGTITFTVPLDAPSILFYQSETDINAGGAIEISSIDDSFIFNIETELLGKKTFKLPNGQDLSNGMKISFADNVTPASYATGEYYVEGVGDAIALVPSAILNIAGAFTVSETVKFDNKPFDKEPFGDVIGYASEKDYIVVNRSSKDYNPWSRYNRWFHKDVIIASAEYNGTSADIDQTSRAVRPIIEFEPSLRLFNFGDIAISDVDLIDNFTTDVFSVIEGSIGYNIDGVPVSEGQVILFTADPDPLVQNKTFKVTFVNILGFRQIHLVELDTPVANSSVLVKQGITNQGRSYWFDGTSWIYAQQKEKVNQPPLFDIVDENGISFGDLTEYPSSTFKGTTIFGYKAGLGKADTVLGFPIAYQNVGNIGDIVFNFTLVSDSFEYKVNNTIISKNIDVGYLSKLNSNNIVEYKNGWKVCELRNHQPAIRIYKDTTSSKFFLDMYDDVTALSDLDVKIYINGNRVDRGLWSLEDTIPFKTVSLDASLTLTVDDILTIKTTASQPINANAYYEVPISFQNNPLNGVVGDFTLGEVINHVDSIIDNVSNLGPSHADVLPYDFIGAFPGSSNLRDLGNVTAYGTKFVQHSGPAGLSIYHVTNENNNIIRALEQANEDYNNFKRIFVNTASSLGVDGDPVSIVDLVLQKINLNKPNVSPYYFSDMVPYGAALVSKLTVVDYRIKKYPLSSVFSLDSLSNKAVGVYLNGVQLVHGRDYTFDTQGFIVVTATIKNDDVITTYEYESTDGCFVPSTPTKLGLWPSYEPKLYLDTSLVTPRWMIQGHDGSQVLAYGSYGEGETADYRDDLILELEKRIFNNIKVKYDPSIFDITDIVPRYDQPSLYSFDEYNEVLAPYFYKWTDLIGKNYSQPLNYDINNSFTFNYAGLAAPNGTTTPGYWRGVYRLILDTDRPNICPWEMLGISIEPAWWVDVYGTAPYTSDNIPMWKDISEGIVREPGKPLQYLDRYKKPFLLNHIPVNEYGELRSPLDSGLAFGTITPSVAGRFVFGDVGPVEAAWRRSSHYPFSVLTAASILMPSKVFGLGIDRSRVVRNKAGQIVYKDTNLRIRPQDIKLPSVYSSKTRVQTSGIINYIVDLIFNYTFSNNLKSYNLYSSDLSSMTVKLGYRVGSFTNKDQFNLLLESKTPISGGNVFIPQEDYSVNLNKSNPINKIVYSGVIITKMPTGYEVKGYSKTHPYFNYYPYVKTGMLVNVGGISESFSKWAPNNRYVAGSIVFFNNSYYQATQTTTSSSTFDASVFQHLPSLPVTGGRTVSSRTAWDRKNPIVVPYGTEFEKVQDVYDFLVGYGEFLKDQGFVFDDYNSNLQSISNWETSAKEFLFWTTQNWDIGQEKWSDWFANQPVEYGSVVRYNGEYYSPKTNLQPSAIFDYKDYIKLDGLSTVGNSVISLSPAANKVTLKTDLTVVDDISNSFNKYEFYKVDGTPIQPSGIDVYKDASLTSYTSSTNDGIFSASFYLVQHEHVVILENKTIFNDIIYNLESGYRRDRIKVSGYVTSGWNGSFNIPGFIFDQAFVESWKAWKDYNIGDTVKYQGYYYSANVFIPGSNAFDITNWTLLASKPEPKILPNWTNSATQFTDFYNLDSDSFNSNQQTVAQHLIGYQKRQYLKNIIQDNVSEFKFYQGMIRDKGTQNVFNNLFGVLGADGKDSLTFYEEWALRVGQYGARSAYEELEIILNESQVKSNPQGIVLTNAVDEFLTPFIIQQTPNDVYLKPQAYNSKPFPVVSEYKKFLRDAGYVNSGDVKLSIGSMSEILNESVANYTEGDYIWTAFVGNDWNVYKYTNSHLKVLDVSYSTNVLTITFDSLHGFSAGDYIGVYSIPTISNFYNISSVTNTTITINTAVKGWVPPFTSASSTKVYKFVSHRTDSIDNLDTVLPSSITAGDLVWTDKTSTGSWGVWEHAPVFTESVIENPLRQTNLYSGKALAISADGKSLIASNNIGKLVVYEKAGESLQWTHSQIINKILVTADTTLDVAGVLTAKSTTVYTPSASGSLIGGLVIGTGIVEDTYVVAANDGISIELSRPASTTSAPGSFTLTIVTNVNSNSILATKMAMSSDGIWLAVGSPNAGYASSKYVGSYNGSTTYSAGSIVTKTVTIDGSQVTTAYRALSQTTGTLVVNSQTQLPSGNIPWEYIPYIPVDLTGTSSTLVKQGVVSIFKKDVNGRFNFVDSLLSPLPTSNELFGSVLKFSNSVSPTISYSLHISAPGYSNRGKVYRADYGRVTKVTTYYNSVGSKSTTLKVQSTAGISEGMYVLGTGFTSDQVVSKVVNSTTLTLSAEPDSTPSGTLSFAIEGWGFFDNYAHYVAPSNSTNFGSTMTVSADGSTLAISGLSSVTGTAGFVNVYSGITYSSAKPTPQVLYRNRTSTPSTTGSISFGRSLDFSATGSYLLVSDSLADNGEIKLAGQVMVYSKSLNYSNPQTLVNHHIQPSGNFGDKVQFLNDDTIVVYSVSAPNRFIELIDSGTTTFDDNETQFIAPSTPNGRVDIYNRYNTAWVYGESLDGTFDEPVGYGNSIVAANNIIVVGSPNAIDNNVASGKIYSYSNTTFSTPWALRNYGAIIPDVKKVKHALLYNRRRGELLTYLDVIDPLQGKIAGPAEEEIKFKTFYDPAKYSNGTAALVVDEQSYWTDRQVGMLWWDLRTAKFVNNYSNDYVYRTSMWNTLAAGASIDIYEWVSTSLLPSKWDAIADTPAGLASNVSGKSLYGDAAYSIKKTYDNISKTYKNTYYYWVKNKKVVPSVSGRHISANDVSLLISNPRGQGYSCLALTGNNSVNVINAAQYIQNADTVLSIEYWTIEKTDQNIHSQWKVISNNPLTDLPSTIVQKWVDSLCGIDVQGRSVPDTSLPPKLRYGIENRPRQGMYVNRIEALKQIVEYANTILISNQIVETRDLSKLESYDTEPSTVAGLYDSVVDSDLELRFVNVGLFKAPTITPQVSKDGKIIGINIVYAGQGYLVAPYIQVYGTGEGAVLKATIDSLGRITGATVVSSGEGYDSSTTCTIRNYSTLVHTDTTSSGSWAIYAYDPASQTWTRERTQSYDVRNYWNAVDWYDSGYNQFTLVDFAVDTIVDLNSIQTAIGEIVKIRTNSKGKWTLLEKYAESQSYDWTQSYKVVGIEGGTIQLSSNLYNFAGTDVGYDTTTYGGTFYDIVASKELRLILNALKDNIFIDDLKQEYLNLFFVGVKYALSEQAYVDWIFKTSFVRANYNLGNLDQPVNYPIDNLKDFEDYIAEVKPYRTKVREYVSQYNSVDYGKMTVTDFDVPPIYSNNGVTLINTFVTADEKLTATDSAITTYPWKYWLDNVGFKLIDIKIIDGGSGYLLEPTVKITSKSGHGAVARAYVANGKVNRIDLISEGSGYLTAPTIEIIGGISGAGTPAKVVAIIGDSLIRSNLVGIKFDRTSQGYYITQTDQAESFVGSGSKLQFALKWAPDIAIGTSVVTVDGQPLLREQYSLSVVKGKGEYTKYSGLLTLTSAPAKDAKITVSYKIDQSVLSATDRILHYYDPGTNSFGKDLSQLMTGIDYGGVIVSGLSFSTSAGFDSEPYFTGKWDSYDLNYDNFKVILAANSNVISLPYTPAVNTVFNVYKEDIKEQLIENTDGVATSYDYNLNVYDPSVYVSKDTTTTQYVNKTFVSIGFVGSIITMIVNSTSGIVKGMSIIGTGFNRNQTVDTIINSTTLTLTGLPNTTIINVNEPLTFTFNYAGSNKLVVANTNGIIEGDIVSSSTSTFTYGTTVKKVINSTDLELDTILYNNIPLSSTVTFTRKLKPGKDVTISPNGILTIAKPLVAGSNIKVTGKSNPVRLDDPYFNTIRQTNPNAIMPSPTGYGVELINVLDKGVYTRIPPIVIENSPLAANSPSYTATVGSIVAEAIDANIAVEGKGYAVNDTLTVGTSVFKIASLKTQTGKVVSTSGADVTLSSTDNIAVGDSFVIAGPGAFTLVATGKYFVSHVSGTQVHLAASFEDALIDNFIIFPAATVNNTTFTSGSLLGRPATLALVTPGTFTVSLNNSSQLTITNSTLGTGCKLSLVYGIKSIAVAYHGWGYTESPTVQIGKPWVANTAVALNDDIVYNGNHYLVTTAGTLDSTPPVHLDGSILYGSVFLEYIGPSATAFAVLSIDKLRLPSLYTVNENDTFIIRNSTSDGSAAPNEADYDTDLSGGDLAYSTAKGIAADDIVVDGDGFVTPTTSPAPEEVVPGQVVDTLAIKVFDRKSSGSAVIKVDNYSAEGRTVFPISQVPNSPEAVIVKADNNILTYGDDFTVDYQNQSVVLNDTFLDGTLISIFSIGFAGTNILDNDYFVGNGNTFEFVTKAPWQDSVTALVYINGVVTNPMLFKTDSSYVVEGAIGFRYGAPPAPGDLINYIIVQGDTRTFAITNVEKIQPNGNMSYTLEQPIGNNLPLESNMIVRVNQSILSASNNTYFTIGKNRLKYTIDKLTVLPNTVTSDQIVVTVGSTLLKFGVDYTLNLNGITVSITKAAYTKYSGKTLVVSIIKDNEYFYNAETKTITFSQSYNNTDVIEVVSSYLHDVLDIERTTVNVTTSASLDADSVEYFTYKEIASGIIKLDRPVKDDSYVWVVADSKLLSPSVDYKLTDNKTVKLLKNPEANTQISLITFGNNIVSSSNTIAYMQFKDMLNRTVYKRLSANKQTALAQDLNWSDKFIRVVDGSKLNVPNKALNRPGVIEIQGERIEYYELKQNTLSQLRRGTLGTGVRATYVAGSHVQDIGFSETVPYTDDVKIHQVVSEGETEINLDYVPTSANEIEVFVGGYNASNTWTSNTVYEVDDIVLVGQYNYRCITAHTSSSTFSKDSTNWTFFIGNIRLKKQPYTVHNVNNAPYSPAGDVTFPADFTVDGKTAKITLANSVASGVVITVIKKTISAAWDVAGILNEDNKVSNFIKAEPGIWYASYNPAAYAGRPAGQTVTFDDPTTSFDTNNITFDQG